MLEGYDWLHFVGHGRLNARHQRVDLLMEDDLGNTRTIADHLFSGMLARQGVQPQLVFLSVCQSAGTPGGEVLASLRALNQARNAVLSAQLPGAATPVLFMHLASGRLWHTGDPAPPA